MERMLVDNDDKGGWDRCTMFWLLDKVSEEVREARDAVITLAVKMLDRSAASDYPSREFECLIDEAADIANYAMMVADRARKMQDKNRG